jgi:hypothetical protein
MIKNISASYLEVEKLKEKYNVISVVFNGTGFSVEVEEKEKPKANVKVADVTAPFKAEPEPSKFVPKAKPPEFVPQTPKSKAPEFVPQTEKPKPIKRDYDSL